MWDILFAGEAWLSPFQLPACYELTQTVNIYCAVSGSKHKDKLVADYRSRIPSEHITFYSQDHLYFNSCKAARLGSFRNADSSIGYRRSQKWRLLCSWNLRYLPEASKCCTLSALWTPHLYRSTAHTPASSFHSSFCFPHKNLPQWKVDSLYQWSLKRQIRDCRHDWAQKRQLSSLFSYFELGFSPS